MSVEEHTHHERGMEFTDLPLSPDVMSEEEFNKFDERQEEFLLNESKVFFFDEDADDLKLAASRNIRKNFIKGVRQFCAAGRALFSYGKPKGFDEEEDGDVAFQHDHKLGNTNICGERMLLTLFQKTKRILGSIVTYRGENVEKKDGGLQTRQERGGSTLDLKTQWVMSHMVTPCGYCREGICRHNPECMVIMPPGNLRKGEEARGRDKNAIQLPVFMIYPEKDLFEKEDALEKKLEKEGKTKLLEARRNQRRFIREVAKDYPVTEADLKLLKDAEDTMSAKPPTEKPYLVISSRSVTDKVITVDGEIPMPQKPEEMSYVDYPRNEVQILFIDKMLKQAVPKETISSHSKAGHALNVFVELYREPGSDKVKLILPDADMRQRIIDRYERSFVLIELDGEIVKLPIAALIPNRYKRFDKKAKNGRV